MLTHSTSQKGSQDSAVGIASGYGLGDQGVGVRVPVGSRIFSTLSRPVLGVKVTTHLQLVPRSRKCGSIHPSPIRFDGVVLSYLSTGTTLPYLTFPKRGMGGGGGARARVCACVRACICLSFPFQAQYQMAVSTCVFNTFY
jgi:hypothetical protein